MGMAAAGVSAAGGLLGGLIGSDGAQQAAQAQSSSDLYQAMVAYNNAQIATENAKQQMLSGDISAQNELLSNKAKIGTMTASMGANGVDVNSGSNAAIQEGADRTSMLDALTIRSNSAKDAYGYLVQASNQNAQAGLDEMASSNALQAGQIASDTSLLSGATSVARAFAPFSTSSFSMPSFSTGVPNGTFGFNLGTG